MMAKRKIRPFLERLLNRLFEVGLPFAYVQRVLEQKYVRQLFGAEALTKLEGKWMNKPSVSKRHQGGPFLGRFGNGSLLDEKIPDGLRCYEKSGGFEHKGDRKNIAKAKYVDFGGTHLEDFRRGKRRFSPIFDVVVQTVEVEVIGVPINNYRFLLGDGCLYAEESDHWITEGISRMIPCPSEVHCTAISIWESTSFVRSLELPGDLPLFLSRREVLSLPQHFTRHMPHEISDEDLGSVDKLILHPIR